jgi:dimethylargininase
MLAQWGEHGACFLGGLLMLIALTRPVSPTIDQCELTHLSRTPIDVPRAVLQHRAYEQCLVDCGCQLHSLPALPDCPDAVFVEDTCVIFDEIALMTRPGAISRRRETESVASVIKQYRKLHWIEAPGTLDGGDVLRLGRRVFVGRSGRTNAEGIEQTARVISAFGYPIMAVDFAHCLHLKSAATEVASDAVLVNPCWVDPDVFEATRTVIVDPEEPAAANALRIGKTVIYPTGYPKTEDRLRREGIELVTVDLSELAKAEGAATCCSLVFESSPLC